MTKRRLLALAGVLACGLALSGAAAAEDTGKVYGKGVSQRTAVRVKTLLEQPARYVGKTVRVDGPVSAVCQSMGCWLEITDPELGRGVRFKVQDGVIVFPKDAVGRQASAEGVFEEIATSPVRETMPGHAGAHEAAGTPAAATRAEKVYWVRATGAVLR